MDRVLDRLARRAVARLPEAALTRLQQARSLVGDGPAVAPFTATRVLALAPHPDDETIGCGGTLALAAAAGATVTVAIATDGDGSRATALPREELARRRRADAVAACGDLGVTDVRFLGHRDGGLPDGLAALAADIATLIADLQPQVVLLPWFGDGHTDHAALNDALVTAGTDRVEVWGAEVWTPAPITRLIDITAVVDAKRAALERHVTASDAFDVNATLGLNRYRSIHGLRGHGWAEGFVALPGPAYAAAVRAARA